MKPKSILRFGALAVAMVFVSHLLAQGAPVVGDQVLGKPVTFAVTVQSGTQPFTYQWQKLALNAPQGTQPSAISGATGATLNIPAVSAADAGVYSVIVSNKAGQTVSNNAVFTITVGPAGATVSMSTPPNP